MSSVNLSIIASNSFSDFSLKCVNGFTAVKIALAIENFNLSLFSCLAKSEN
jgi:hypothetical protein